MKNEFTLAFNEVLDEKQLSKEIILEAIEAAMISAYRKAVNASNAQQVVAKVDPDSGKVLIYAEKEVVDSVHDERTEVTIEEALKVDPNTELGSMVIVETTPKDFGRVAAQTARQVIQQRMREAEREEQFKYFGNQTGEIVNGIVQAVSSSHITLGLDKKAEGIMPRKEQISGERFRVHDRVRALLAEVKQTPRGPQIILSRAHRDFLRRLLEDEVPEIYQGMVEIRSIAREPGQRSKVAVSALQPGIDPVGACVGVRGVRIQAIVRELNEEKIDVIEWNSEPAEFIAKALSPARVVGVFLDKMAKGAKTATVVVPEDQLSLAIGRDGQNARLAAKLTAWRIDIKSLPEAAADAIHKRQSLEMQEELDPREKDLILQVENILTKKSEGRPITPEEYQVLTRFVVGSEQMALERREAEKLAKRERLDTIRSSIPKEAFDSPLDELGIPIRYSILLGGEGYSTIGDLMYQLMLDSDVILGLNGMGPKALAEIEAALDEYRASLPVEEKAEPPVAVGAEVIETTEETQPESSIEPEVEPVDLVEATPEPGTVEEVESEPAEDQPVPVLTEESPQPLIEEIPTTEEMPSEPSSVAEESAVKPSHTDDSLDEWASLEELALEEVTEVAEEDEEDEEDSKGKKKKKGKKSHKEIEYDPDLDMMVVKRKHKRGGKDTWIDDWE
ncbi:MAG TPA: transcription termination factor NusA [Anaerolineales bacterium]|nr:transcription termination factor NusA [Anaerolineales bacterium]